MVRILAALILLAGFSAPSVAGESAKKKPNVVVILADDLGWADLGCYGSKVYKTPNLDRLAGTCAKFTHAYSAAPICSPTRAALLTGKHPARLKLTDWLPGRGDRADQMLLRPDFVRELTAEHPTLASLLRTHGYRTGHIGKWHLGGVGAGPLERGFDVNIAGDHTGTPRSYFAPYVGKDGKAIPGLEKAPKGEYLTDRLTAEAEKFIEAHRDRPFFLHLSHHAVHTPIKGKAEIAAKYQPAPPGKQGNPMYAAMIESLDESVGRILKKLDDLKLADDTIVIFTSDNGGLSVLEGPNTPPTINAPLREGKGFLYEGGIRVPLLVRLPGKHAPSTPTVPVQTIDFLPTILELCGAKNATGIDGKSLVPVFAGKELQRDALYWHYPHYPNQGGKPASSIRSGNYSLIEFMEDGRLELFDVVKDVSQSRNLIETQPALAKEMHAKLVAWRKEVGAQTMARNPNYVPNPQADDGSVLIHSKTATIHGVQLRYEPLPHKTTLGFWTRAEDWASFEFTLRKPGTFEVEILQGCGKGQGGSKVELAVGTQKLPFTVEDTGGFQNFKARTLGKLTFAEAGRYTLTLKVQSKSAAAVMDVRSITLKPVAPVGMGQGKKIPATGAVSADLAVLDELMLKFLEEHDVPGASLAVAKDGKLVYARGFGYSDPQLGTPILPKMRFRIASISKPITAVAILKLLEMGKLKLSDNPFDLLNIVVSPGADPRLRRVTVEQLLQHTAGWDRAVSFDPMFRPLQIAAAQKVAAPAEPNDIIQYMLGQKLDFEPGTRYAYSNFGYCLLGRVIEKTSGMPYDAFVQKHVFDPVGIHATQLGQTLTQAKDEVKYHDEKKNRTANAVLGPNLGKPVPTPYGAWYLEAMDSHGGWISTASDLVRFASDFRDENQSKILKASSIRAMLARPAGLAGTSTDGTFKSVYYGLGWNVKPADELGVSHWHMGALDGTATLLARRHDGLAWAVLFNCRGTPKGAYLGSLIDPLLHQAVDKVKRWPVAADDPTAVIGRLKGKFERDDSGAVVLLDLDFTQATDADLKKLAPLDAVRKIYLNSTKITDAGLKEIVAFKDLHTLDVRSVKIAGTTLNVLKPLTQLNTLYLSHTHVTDEGLKAIAELTQIEILNLRDTKVTNAGMKELATLSRLKTLNLTDTTVGDAGLADVARLTQLTTLYLNKTPTTDAGLQHVAKLKELRTLNLRETAVSNEGMKRVASLKELQSLHLNYTKVTAAGLKHLAALSHLETLNLSGIDLSSGLEIVRPFTKLEHLHLGKTDVTDAALVELAAFKLQTLDLTGTKVTDAGLKHLERLVHLQKLYLDSASVSQGAADALAEKLPKCRVFY